MSNDELRNLFEDPKHTPAILEQLKNKSDECYRLIYAVYRKSFIQQGRQLAGHLDDADFEDIFQDAVIALMKNLEKINLEQRVIDYLFGIFRHKLMKRKGLIDAMGSFDDLQEVVKGWSDVMYGQIHQEHLQVLFNWALELLKDPCKTLLTLKFYHNFSSEAIAENMGYKNETVVYTNVFRCLQRLKELIQHKH